MKNLKVMRIFCLTVMLLAALASVSLAANRDFTILNHTGQAIMQLNVSPSSSRDWQEDILGYSIIPADEDCFINMDIAEKGRYWDIQAILEDGTENVYMHVDLYTVTYVTLGRNGSVSVE